MLPTAAGGSPSLAAPGRARGRGGARWRRPARGRPPPRGRTARAPGGRRRPARTDRRGRTTGGGGGRRGCGGCGPRPRWRGPGWPRRASPTSARSSARTRRPSTRTSAEGEAPRSSFHRASTRRWCPMARWQSMRTGTWLGSPPESERAASRCLTASRQRFKPVADEAVELACRGGLGHLVDELPGDAQGLGVAVALVGARRRGQAVGHLAGLGASHRAGELVDDVGGEGLVGSCVTSVRGAGRWWRNAAESSGRRGGAGPTLASGGVGRHAVEDPDLLGPLRAGVAVVGAGRLALVVGTVAPVLAEQPGPLAGDAPPAPCRRREGAAPPACGPVGLRSRRPAIGRPVRAGGPPALRSVGPAWRRWRGPGALLRASVGGRRPRRLAPPGRARRSGACAVGGCQPPAGVTATAAVWRPAAFRRAGRAGVASDRGPPRLPRVGGARGPCSPRRRARGAGVGGPARTAAGAAAAAPSPLRPRRRTGVRCETSPRPARRLSRVCDRSTSSVKLPAEHVRLRRSGDAPRRGGILARDPSGAARPGRPIGPASAR